MGALLTVKGTNFYSCQIRWHLGTYRHKTLSNAMLFLQTTRRGVLLAF
jgi:hypothetical protein